MVIVPTPPSGLLVTWKDQACLSCDTLAEEIVEPGACRVLARSPFGYGHEPDGGIALEFVVVSDFVLVAAGLADVHAAASTETRARTRQKLPRARPIRITEDMARLPRSDR